MCSPDVTPSIFLLDSTVEEEMRGMEMESKQRLSLCPLLLLLLLWCCRSPKLTVIYSDALNLLFTCWINGFQTKKGLPYEKYRIHWSIFGWLSNFRNCVRSCQSMAPLFSHRKPIRKEDIDRKREENGGGRGVNSSQMVQIDDKKGRESRERMTHDHRQSHWNSPPSPLSVQSERDSLYLSPFITRSKGLIIDAREASLFAIVHSGGILPFIYFNRRPSSFQMLRSLLFVSLLVVASEARRCYSCTSAVSFLFNWSELFLECSLFHTVYIFRNE